MRDGDANHHGVLLDTVCVRFDLVVDLGAHAAGDREGDEVGNKVDDVRRLACLLHKDGDDVEDARGELQAVREGDDLVVPRVGPDPLGVHEVQPRDGDGEDGAAASLEAEAELGSAAHVGRVHAAAVGDVALEANVVLHAARVLVEHSLAGPARGQAKGRAEAGEDAAARLNAARVLESERKLVWVVLRRNEFALLDALPALGVRPLGRRVRTEEEADHQKWS
mmetsp:Transcript_15952/g.51141  ORF Transcript_15952/g.51141 Transcript_15952/m.51141 type:complete len:223 (-) Transcript_15952:49-717(-)